jgi:thiamine-monophosphate kinase
LQVSGAIGDGYLGLKAARGELVRMDRALAEVLVVHYQTPRPRLDLSLESAHAAADISDGLLADAGHIARASGVGVEIALDTMPLSPAGRAWVADGSDRRARLSALAVGGDDYQIVAAASEPMAGFTVVGRVVEGEGVQATLGGSPVEVSQMGYRHGNLG